MQTQLPMGSLNRSRASHAAFKILNVLQDEPLEYMAAAIGLVLEALCEQKNLSRGDIMLAVSNMLRTQGLADDNYVTALRTFIKTEVPSP